MRFCLTLIAALTLAAASVAPAGAEPPPWAPAHRWRAKHGDRGGPPAPAAQAAPAPIADRGAGDFLRCNRELAGRVVGGAVGAAVGAQVGQGHGRLVATGAGALLGVLLGGEIGAALDRRDRACVGRTLERVPSGRTVAWRNPDTGTRLRTTPGDTYRNAAGRYCREYTTSAQLGGDAVQVYGTACRQPDGSWEIQS